MEVKKIFAVTNNGHLQKCGLKNEDPTIPPTPASLKKVILVCYGGLKRIFIISSKVSFDMFFFFLISNRMKRSVSRSYISKLWIFF